jgi:hypothetical protein
MLFGTQTEHNVGIDRQVMCADSPGFRGSVLKLCVNDHPSPRVSTALQCVPLILRRLGCAGRGSVAKYGIWPYAESRSRFVVALSPRDHSAGHDRGPAYRDGRAI